MPCHTRMKSIFLRGLLWLYLLELGFMLVSPEPGYLDFDNLPDTNFSCAWRIVGGYYADVEAACQMFHVCTLGQNNETMDIRFLCLNGTVFDQSTRVCERIDEVDCEKSEQYYDNNRELYGNSAPLIIPGDPEVTSPSSTTTTTTTTTTPRPHYYTTARQVNRHHYYTTAKVTTLPPLNKLSLHHHQFSSDSPPDFRFNPKEINLKLNPDSSPVIKPVSYQQQRFNDDKNQHTIVTTHSYKEQTKKKPVDYDFDYQEDKNYQNYQPTGDEEYEDYKTQYHTTHKVLKQETSTFRISPTSQASHGYHFQRSDRPPLSPALLYASLSSPAPFSHSHSPHTGNKRHSDPKIKKSVSVSISDQNGKELAKLNNTPISAIFSDSYLDYTEEDVTLIPLFEDVPKIPKRQKRTTDKKVEQLSMNEKEAADVLRFLLNWYTNYEKTTKPVSIPLNSETITEINDELSPLNATLLNKTENVENVVVRERKHNREDELIANASKNKLNYEEYFKQEDLKNVTENHVNQTKEDDDYYYEYQDVDQPENDMKNKTETNEISKNSDKVEINVLKKIESQENIGSKKYIHRNEPITVVHDEIQIKENESEDTSDLEEDYESGKEQNINKQVEISENDKGNEQNNDVISEEIPLYDYVDDNYEAKAYDIEKINSNVAENNSKTLMETVKDLLNDYIDDNYEVKSFNNDIPKNSEHPVNSQESPDNENSNETSKKPYGDFEKYLEKYSETTEKHLQETTENYSVDTYKYFENADVTTDSMLSTITEANTQELVPITEYSETKDSSNEIHDETSTYLNNEITYSTQITTEGFTPTTEEQNEIILTTDSSDVTTESIWTTASNTGETVGDSSDIQSTESIQVNGYSSTTESIIPTNFNQTEESTPIPSTPTTQSATMSVIKETVEDLEVMIKDIEKHTKSIATTIVMPASSIIPTIHPKAEDTIVENSPASSVTASVNEVRTDSSVTTVTTPKVTKTTRSSARTRGNHRFNFDSTRNSGRNRVSNRSRNRVTTTTKEILITTEEVPKVDILHQEAEYRSRNQVTTEEMPPPTTEEVPKADITHLVMEVDIPKRTNQEIIVTDPSLIKSANPTLARNRFSSTTPLNRFVRVKFRKEKINKKYVFTCLDKRVNKYYSDSRDCRLFHYCSPGYTSTQLVDMKFVCDLGTYFDENKLICSKIKPTRCL